MKKQNRKIPVILSPVIILGTGTVGLRVVLYIKFIFNAFFGEVPNSVVFRVFETTETAKVYCSQRDALSLITLTSEELISLSMEHPEFWLERLNPRSIHYDPDLAKKYSLSTARDAIKVNRMGGGAANCPAISGLILEDWGKSDISKSLCTASHIIGDRTVHDNDIATLQNRGWNLEISNRPFVITVGGTTGATSKVSLPITYYLRDISSTSLCFRGVFTIPNTLQSSSSDSRLSNTWAFMQELQHFSHPRTTFSWKYPDRVIKTQAAPFEMTSIFAPSSITPDGTVDLDALNLKVASHIFNNICGFHHHHMDEIVNLTRFNEYRN